ncbi:4Fe-4S dicluster domain-containing protein [Falsiroseomonas sp. HW251]|uniref:4Fe-4S dicluster domain-containing protein n=1 Tax=Falsiroseomonas sp. HW251 TaxID=3390998 RepID=UPI003D31B95B
MPPDDAIGRRQAALGLLAAALTGALGGCDRPEEEILPYVRMPERLVPGRPLTFATSLPLEGQARGVLVTSFEGRPTKVSGNPSHPASRGATDVFAEAEVLSLYDPDRSRAVRIGDRIGSWDSALAALLPRLAALEARGGEGLRLLTGPITSPTLVRLIGDTRRRFPAMHWHVHAAVGEANRRDGAALAFGRTLAIRPRLDRAAVTLALDADPLGPGAEQIANARAFAARRMARAGATGFSRLYVAEPLPTLTGASGDHRLCVHPAVLRDMAVTLAARLGADLAPPDLPPDAARFLDAALSDLQAHRGEALVLTGEWQDARMHALVHWINARLDAPIGAIEPLLPDAPGLDPLVEAMQAGQVEALFVLGANPAYDAPAALGFAEARRRVPFLLHHGLHRDETAALSDIHVPAPHALEEWGDLRAPDGTASLVQPLIRPLYGTRGMVSLLGVLAGTLDVEAHPAVRATWAGRTGLHGDAFEAWWREALHAGVVPDSSAPPVPLPPPRPPEAPERPLQEGRILALRPDPTIWDGVQANNAWLQECPKPFTSQTWGNAALMNPRDASARGVGDGDVVTLDLEGRRIEAPVLLREEVAPGVVGLTLGYGRRAAGAIGSGLGVDAYAIRRPEAPWYAPGLSVTSAGHRARLATRQDHQTLEGEAREILPVVPLDEIIRAAAQPPAPPPPDFYPDVDYDGYAWGMVIDTTLCIGCNACVVACQSENNVPVVGPEQIAMGRVMHWLRVDTYTQRGPGGAALTGFQPVPCMHCEKAPCEPVCPVAASVHDHEGLNVQVYNRCIGTRFCQSNCPYKVRRFNFFGYADGQEYANQGAPSLAAQRNPEVTVRARGVMEKCTYCVQRISQQRREAKKENRAIGDGEVVTACQAACPTQAIVFGDLNQPRSSVAALRREPHHYALLGHLGTRPRTTYLKQARNPNPALEEEG